MSTGHWVTCPTSCETWCVITESPSNPNYCRIAFFASSNSIFKV